EGRITDLGEGDLPDFQESVKIVPATGKHVYPGLISAYTQLGVKEINTISESTDVSEVGDMNPEVQVMVALNPDSVHFPVARANGILSAVVFPSGGLMPGHAGLIRLDGWTTEDMTIVKDLGLVIQWPSPGRSRNKERLQGMGKSIENLENLFQDARAYFSVRESDSKVPVDLRYEGLRSVLESGKDRGEVLPLFIKAQSYDQIVSAVDFSQRNQVRIIIVGGRDSVVCADLLKKYRIPVVLLSTLRLPKRADRPYDGPFQLPGELEAAGIDWCLASDESNSAQRNLPYHAAMAAAFGLPQQSAVKSITLSAARILGVGDQLGSLEPGKSATFFIADGSILEITTHVTDAYIDGRRINLVSKQTRLRDKYREKYRQLGILKTDPDTGRN
ncbi:MAG TPA: imidazolonepropionase, partial [Verrucomicrobia bacterium]|nr:imidazolonepropionase [Verrucomicrobiota bacterium]